jgi:Cof subfamily protein (haloacid dehalogenase superfamily)
VNPLVVCDLDGTLIGASGKVEACVLDAVDRARAAGVKLSVCTGRPGFGVALRVAERIGPTNPHVFQNGAQVGYPDGEMLQVSALRERDTITLIQHAREAGYVLELYTTTALFVERSTTISEAHARMLGVTALVRDLSEVAAAEPVVRAQWVVDDHDFAEVAALSLPGTELSRATSPALPGTNFVSVTRSGVSKGSAVRQLSEAMRIPLERIMAIGDSVGDLPMLEIVGRPIAMGDGDATLRDRFETVGAVEGCGAVAALNSAAAGVG